MSLANQPMVSKLGAIGKTSSVLILLCVGLIPNNPQNDAGILTEPPVSEPIEKSQRLVVKAAADPELDPPGTHPGAFKL